MPNVGDIIRASDIAVPKGIVAPFYNVTLSGRYPIFWGDTEANTGWLVCDGGSDLHGGNVPNLINKFIMGTNTVSGANKTGGTTTTSATSTGGTVGATTITSSTSGSHNHIIGKYYYGNNSPTNDNVANLLTNSVLSINLTYSTMNTYNQYVYSNFANQTQTRLIDGQLATSTNIPSKMWKASNITSQSNITTGAISGGSGSHTHSFTGSSHTHTITPPYYTLIYCVKLP